jgi:hypothetical protein
VSTLTHVYKLQKARGQYLEAFEVPKSTLRKRLKTGTVPTSLGRFEFTFPNEEEK